MSKNPNALDFLEKNQDKINWDFLSSNPNPKTIKLLEKNQDKISWIELASSPNLMYFLKDYKMHEILNLCNFYNMWHNLSKNTHPKAIELLKNNMDKINWNNLSKNPAAIDLLKSHPDKIEYSIALNENLEAIPLIKNIFIKTNNKMVLLAKNPLIFEPDFQGMRKSKHELNESIISAVWHPKRVAKLIEQELNLEEC